MTWPVLDGDYIVGDPDAPVAVCTLTDQRLPERLATLPGVAIVGTLATANLGIERLVRNVVANPAVAHLLVCGKDSALFGPGQSLLALAREGVDGERRIRGATGFDPVLRNLTAEHIDEFRDHVNVVDRIGTDDPAAIGEQVARLAAGPVPARRVPTSAAGSTPPGRRADPAAGPTAAPRRTTSAGDPAEEFVVLAAGGRGRAVDYDPSGFLVVTLDRRAGQILVRHYRPDNTPAHQVRSRNGEAILRALLDHHLVTQLDHAGYLGAELAKAETALRLGLRYVQDRPLRASPSTGTTTLEIDMSTPATDDPSTTPAPAAMPAIGPAQTHRALAGSTPGTEVDITVEIVRDPEGRLFDAAVADPDPADPYTRYRRSGHPVRIRYGDGTRIAMGAGADITTGALLRLRGTIGDDGSVDAKSIAVLTRVATLTGP